MFWLTYWRKSDDVKRALRSRAPPPVAYGTHSVLLHASSALDVHVSADKGRHLLVSTVSFTGLCLYYWHCPHRVQSRDYVTVQCPSVCLSICLSHLPTAAGFSVFAAVGLARRKYGSMLHIHGRRCSNTGQHGTQQRMQRVTHLQLTYEAEHTHLLTWRRGVVVCGVRRMNEVNARRARLVPRWVTIFGRVYHLGM